MTKSLHPVSLQTLGEEIANAITHGIGTALAIVGLTLLVVYAALHGDTWHVVGVSIFGGTMVFLYLASTLYHSFQFVPVKRIFHIMDHVGIALLIAGTYTPFLLIKMRTAQGWTFFVIIWTLAIACACIKSFFTSRFVGVSTAAYVAMGWLSVFIINSMTAAIGIGGMMWLAAGGLSYSLGVIPFLWERLPFNHAIWHLFVMGGTACHFFAVFQYVLPG